MIKLKVSAANIAVEEKETLTEGRVGLLCRFSFTGEWDGLAKTAVFDGADSRDVILTEDTVAVPAECLAAEGYSLSVGVYGKNAAGDIVIPTVYATVGKIQRSAYPAGKEAAPPTPDVVAQIQQAAANAEAMARAVREDADLGKFKGDRGEPGGWYTPEIRQPIKKSMVVNFIPSKEGMPAAEPKLILLPEGEPGGWYTPEITQPDENTMRVSFTPSNEDMPAVEPADITIPTGGGSGTSGEDGGYYTPEVTQTSENTMQVAFTPSKTSMPAVSGKEITLPAGQKGDKGDAGAAGADGKSAYAYAVEGDYTGTEAEFAAKLAQEKYANPEALTFTGAATGSYDGSQPLTVNIPSGGGGDNPWRLIKTVTLEETVKSITVDTDSDGNAFSLSEIYINTNVTNSEDQTVATSFSLKINGKNTNSIGTTAGLYVQCGKTGESGRNWIWLMSLNPLRALHGIWIVSNTASGKTVQCYQPNEFGDTNPNPHSVGEKITGIEIFGLSSTNYLAAGSEFRIYGR